MPPGPAPSHPARLAIARRESGHDMPAGGHRRSCGGELHASP